VAVLGIAGRGKAWLGPNKEQENRMDFRITFEGTASLLMHNSRLSNPLDPATRALKRVTGKRTKTEDDHLEIARLEHAGGLYHDPDVGPYIPGENIWRCLYDAAKKSKRGPRVKEGVFVSSDFNPLAYKGPRDVDGLWADENFRLIVSAKNQQSRIMRCRPIFREWKTDAEGILDTNILDFTELQAIAETAGQLVGLGDWRPRYGRFIATVEQV
jgi:hypothetical protein